MRVKNKLPQKKKADDGNVIMDVNQSVDGKGIRGISRFINSITKEKGWYQIKIVIWEIPEDTVSGNG